VDDALARTLHGAARGDGLVLVLTGAGISAESGIPTFRGEEGFWRVGSRNYHPQEMATQQAFGRMPDEVWRWYLWRRSVCRGAQPNAGHLALVELERALAGRFRLVTQNVDGLHLRAGNSAARTHQIHGNIDFMRCARACTTELAPIPAYFDRWEKDAPLGPDDRARLRCARCGGPARPHVLWFDEYYDEPLFAAESAIAAARGADLLVVVGTAGATNLPLQIAALVARRLRPIVDVNVDDNPFAQLAAETDGFVVRGAAARELPPIVAALADARA
jgi:NAD-dependent deacetylase